MEAFIQQYGLVAVFGISAFEGDIVLLLAGVAVHNGLLGFVPAVLAGMAGAMCGDLGYYGLGRASARLVGRWRVVAGAEARIRPLAARWGAWEVPVSRLIYGTRTASMVFWGIERMPLGRFVGVDLMGVCVWATALVGMGFVSSHGVGILIGELERLEHLMLSGAVAIGLTASVFMLLRTRRSWRSVGGG